MAVGGAQQNLNAGMIKDLPFIIPDLPTQTAIAEILSSLDDKIELNNKINQELETLAQTLFKQWFIDFEFPNENGEPYKSSGGEIVDSELGEIPKGWSVGVLENILDVKGGTTPSTKEPTYWDGDICWTSPRDLSNIKTPILLDTEKKITPSGLSKISSGLLPKGTLLLSSRAPIGYLAITEVETAINQGYIAINGKNGYSNLFFLCWLKSNMNSVIERANGSTFLEISKSNFKQIKIIIPSIETHNQFLNQFDMMFEQIRVNTIENSDLITLRDNLLPKLISGELEINEISN
jgi:type I restriction enzyme S subunit